MMAYVRPGLLWVVVFFLTGCTSNPLLISPFVAGAGDASSQKVLAALIAHDRHGLVAAGVPESGVDQLLKETAACDATAKPFFETDGLYASFYYRQYGLGATAEKPQVVVSIWYDVNEDNLLGRLREVKVAPAIKN